MKYLFTICRVITGLMAVGSLGILLLIVLLRSGLAFAKESAGVFAYVARLFTSGFTEGTPPSQPAGWIIGAPLAVLFLLFTAQAVSLFYPGTKSLLHVLAAFTLLACVWYGHMLMTEVKLEILCLPALGAWLVYYALCLWGPPGLTE